MLQLLRAQREPAHDHVGRAAVVLVVEVAEELAVVVHVAERDSPTSLVGLPILHRDTRGLVALEVVLRRPIGLGLLVLRQELREERIVPAVLGAPRVLASGPLLHPLGHLVRACTGTTIAAAGQLVRLGHLHLSERFAARQTSTRTLVTPGYPISTPKTGCTN